MVWFTYTLRNRGAKGVIWRVIEPYAINKFFIETYIDKVLKPCREISHCEFVRMHPIYPAGFTNFIREV
jgi:hypothetical protein